MIRLRRLEVTDFKPIRHLDLEFPSRGRFLVQGLNESGKSTLFEAIFFALFGAGLPTDGARGKLDELVRYGAEEARVALELELLQGRRLTIRRTLRVNRANVWELDILDADGVVDEVRGNAAVNERIEAELGLDGDALLNTCFVEQKKLDKLEGLTKAQRERSLMRLLNLDRLLALEEKLRVKEADEEQVRRLEARATLAAVTAELPELEARERRLQHAVAAHAALSSVQAALQVHARLSALEGEIGEAGERERDLAAQAAEAQRFADAVATLRETAIAHARAVEADDGVIELSTTIGRLKRIEQTDLPSLVARRDALARLRRRLEWLEGLRIESERHRASVETMDGRLGELAAGRERLNDLKQQLVETAASARDAESSLEGARHDVRAFDVRDAIAGWLRTNEDLQNLVASDTRQNPAATQRAMRTALIQILAGVVLLASAGVDFSTWPVHVQTFFTFVDIAAALSGLMLLVFALIRFGAIRAHAQRSEARRVSMQADHARLAVESERATARLRELNTVAPATVERAAIAVAEIDARIAGRSRSQVEAEITSLTETRALAMARRERLEQEESILRGEVGGVDARELGKRRDAAEDRALKMRDVSVKRRAHLAPMAERLGAALDLEQLARAFGACEHEIHGLQSELASADSVQQRLEIARTRAEKLWSAAAQGWQSLGSVPGLATWQRPMPADAWQRATDLLTEAYSLAGGEAVREAADAALRQAAGLEGKRTELDRELETKIAEAMLAWRDWRPIAPPSPPADLGPMFLPGLVTLGVADREPDLVTQAGLRVAETALKQDLARDEPLAAGMSVVQADLDEVRARIGVNRHEIGRLEAEIGPGLESLNPRDARDLVAAQRRDLEVRTRAATIVTTAARRMMREVLPSTLDYMRRLLPLLTDGRYFDAQLADDYRIEVYDDKAAAWRRKDIFSGGAKDQFSLALRLAFALATLPEERGTAPSFLFLDEPLGGFDVDRAKALVEILTEGEVAESFDQVFLISHVPVAGALFDYRIVMDDGAVVGSELPVTDDPQRAEARPG